MGKNTALIRVIIAIIAAVVVGLYVGSESTVLGVSWVRIFALIGQLFLNALTLVVVPLVGSSIICGTARIGKEDGFGQLGFRTFTFFILTTILAVFVGLLVSFVVSPGTAIDREALASLLGDSRIAALEQRASAGVFDQMEQLAYRIIPSNILLVASHGQILGIIFFCIIFGFFASRVEPESSKTLTRFWQGVFQVMMLMTHFVLYALPIGVFGLVAKVVALQGIAAIKTVPLFFASVLLGLGIFMFLILPILVKVIADIRPLRLFQSISPALIAAFSTSSTAATLPVTMECMEKNMGVPNRICSFTLPLGTSLNLTGTALYVTVAVIFISQAYGVELDLGTLVTICILAVFTGLGMVAGIPSGSLITIIVILQTIGIPSDGIYLILAVERILDMFRTVVSVSGNACCTLLVQGKKGVSI